MEYLLGLVVIVLLFWVFSTKKQMTAVRSFSAIDAAKPWFQENDLDAGKAKFSSYVIGLPIVALLRQQEIAKSA